MRRDHVDRHTSRTQPGLQPSGWRCSHARRRQTGAARQQCPGTQGISAVRFREQAVQTDERSSCSRIRTGAWVDYL